MSAFSVILAQPRGFCAGVDRAIDIVEMALQKYGAPIYVRHEIVHNRHVVDTLRAKGAVFVEELDEVPEGAVVIFSAHGVARSVVDEALRRQLRHIDATCPLVTKVHREAAGMASRGRHLVLIGHAGHPEVEGTLGQVPEGSMTLVERVEDVATLVLDTDLEIAFVTQTTLSMDDTAEIVAALQAKYPGIRGPKQEDICYATQNRQNAVKSLAHRCEVILVLGAPNSSNSNRLVEVARQAGCRSHLLQTACDLDPAWLDGATAVGVTAGASAPEQLVQELVTRLRDLGATTVDTDTVATERVQFSLPQELTAG
ncbi:MAG: 4-hydroxy-3-methylbut-2-enyl diphosphate reductase [Planctomycetota bacterium]|nr:4-hydroxy-3-methylbut-2-enyl diphosphate reductase [Planctomycetota bacterium]